MKSHPVRPHFSFPQLWRVRSRLCWLTGLILLLRCAAVQAQFQTTPNPASAGLWVGEVTLRNVSVARTGAPDPTPSPASLRIILHVDSSGQVRLLKEVILAQKSTPAFDVALVTSPALLAGLPLATESATPNVRGQRFATASYDFKDNDSNPSDNALELSGGLGQNFQCTGTLLLDSQHPTNPFRHKFHPDHANDGAKAYSITRTIKLQFIAPSTNVNGRDQFTGTYEEQITGLHNVTLTAAGTVVLNRVSTVGTLNQ